MIKLSLIIPAKDVNDPKLKDLLRSIEAQDFPKAEMEILVVTEGTSESAKAIGIRKSKGEVIGILASDNELIHKRFLTDHYLEARNGASQPTFYHYRYQDNVLNRYFSLMGCNDPLAHYMGKKDKWNYTMVGSLTGTRYMNSYGVLKDNSQWGPKTIGDNGYFVKKSLIEKTDLDNYYHIDNALEADCRPTYTGHEIWHKTGGNIFKFFQKRYRYGLQHAFNKNRRWHLVDFKQPEDIRRFAWFIFATLTLIQPLSLSVRGYLKVRDVAWFLHWPAMILTLFTYGLLVASLGIRRLLQSLSVPLTAQRA